MRVKFFVKVGYRKAMLNGREGEILKTARKLQI